MLVTRAHCQIFMLESCATCIANENENAIKQQYKRFKIYVQTCIINAIVIE